MASTKIVGFLHNTHEGLEGEGGSLMNYVLAANGLFAQAESPLLTATVQAVPAEVRGLAPLPEAHVELPMGLVPYGCLQEAVGWMAFSRPNELCVEVVWIGTSYAVQVPEQKATPISVHYTPSLNVVLTLHSHPDMEAFFSGTDDHDESGLGLFGVVGGTFPPVAFQFRVGVYGYFQPVAPRRIFKEWPWVTD